MNKIKKLISDNFLLILIILFGTILRSYQISTNPPSLNWDEVSHGYNAYSILKTSKDEWGQTLPTIFRAYGDYKLPLYIYGTVLPIALFGLNVFAVRFASLVAGVLTILFTYKLTHELFREDKDPRPISLLSAFLVAVQPWTLFLSRGAFEANLALTLIISGFYYLLKGLRRPNYLILGCILLSLSVWTYNSARLFVPLMLIVFGSIYFRDLKTIFRNSRIQLIISLFTILLFLVPMFYQLFNPEGSARYGLVAVIDQGLVNRINEARNSNNLSQLLEKLLYNKVTFAVPEIAKNWLSHYSPSFLFLRGGSNYQFSVPDNGILFPINLVFFYAGLVVSLISVFKKKMSKRYLFILSWLAAGSVASSMTREAPHVLRAITILPIPMILISVGFIYLVRRIRFQFPIGSFQISAKRMIIFGFVLLNLLFLGNYLDKYFNQYKSNYSWSWQYGNKQMVDYVKENYDGYAKIIITKKYGEPHEFLLFHGSWDPSRYQDDTNKIRFYQSNWYWVDKFDKFYFVNDWEVIGTEEDPKSPTRFILESRAEDIDCSQVKCLVVTSPGNIPDSWNKLETIYFLDSKPAYEIYEN